MFFSAYGLQIQSEIDLLLPQIDISNRQDVNIRFGEVDQIDHYRAIDGVWYQHYQNTTKLRWDRIGSYNISNGSDVCIMPLEPVNHVNIRQPLLGTIMAVVMQQRGDLVLHGSAVLINGKAIIFCGNKGQGKSTLAAYLASQGCSIISDDVCALNYDKKSISIRPAFPRIKLYEDALNYLGNTSEKYVKVHPDVPKYICEMDGSFVNRSCKVGSIYILENGDELEIEPLHGVESMKQILAHTMVNRFPENQPIKLREEVFVKASLLLQQVPVYRLTRPRNFRTLDQLKDRIFEVVA